MGPWRQDRLVALCGGAALLSLAVHGLGASLTWVAPADCPRQDDAERALIEALGAPLADTPPAEITVQLASDPDELPSSEDPSPRWAVEASLVGDHGSLPGLAPGVELGATFGSSAHALRLTGLAFPERSTVLDAPSGGTFALFAASLAGCAARTTRHLHLAACAGAELGRMQGRGTGISAPTEGSAFWLAPRVDVAASTLSDFRPFLRAGAVLPLVRPTFALDGRPVHQADALAFRLAVGVEVVLE